MAEFKVGFAKTNINPPLGIGIYGYYVERNAKGFLDDLEVNVFAFQSGKTTSLLISIDHSGSDKIYVRIT